MEPYLHKVGSKEAGQHWTEVAEHLNSRVGFRENPRDQGSVRERFNKFKGKPSSEVAASGIAVDPLTENADFKACTHEAACPRRTFLQHAPGAKLPRLHQRFLAKNMSCSKPFCSRVLPPHIKLV